MQFSIVRLPLFTRLIGCDSVCCRGKMLGNGLVKEKTNLLEIVCREVVNPFNAKATFIESTITESHLNPVMLVFIR